MSVWGASSGFKLENLIKKILKEPDSIFPTGQYFLKGIGFHGLQLMNICASQYNLLIEWNLSEF